MPRSPHPADFVQTVADGMSRPLSLWPDSVRPAGGGIGDGTFESSTFGQAPADGRSKLDFCHSALALRAVLLVQAVLGVGALLVSRTLLEWALIAAVQGFVGLAGTLLWLVGVCAMQRWLRGGPMLRRATAVPALGALAALVGWLPIGALGLADPADPLRAVGVALAGALLGALLWSWLEWRARLWQPVDARVRLAELQSRIRPHFLFNALNTALALVRTDPPRAEAVLEDLAELFRTALADTGIAVSLDEEIALARRYLAIEQIRFGERLQMQWDIDPRAGRVRVPPLLLQPLVENAVRHGVEPSPRGAKLLVRAQVRRAQVVLEVINSVPDEPSVPGHGMALHNVRERLRLLHDLEADFEAGRDGALFRVRIVLPL